MPPILIDIVHIAYFDVEYNVKMVIIHNRYFEQDFQCVDSNQTNIQLNNRKVKLKSKWGDENVPLWLM